MKTIKKIVKDLRENEPEPILHEPVRFMFAIVIEDGYGQSINLFKTHKQAKQFYKLIK